MPPSIKIILVVVLIVGGSFLFLAALPFLAAIGLVAIIYYSNKFLKFINEDDGEE